MSSYGSDWTEEHLVEDKAIELLQRLGWTYVTPEALAAERQSLKEVFLTRRLRAALKRLNPWLSDDNLHKAIRAVTHVDAPGLLEANEALYTSLTYGIALEQDLGAGKKSQTLRFIDFDAPATNELIVTRQFQVRGTKKTIIPDVMLLVNGIPLVLIECKSPALGDKWKAAAVEQMLRYQEVGDRFTALGAPRLFEPMQILVATCGQRACYGTVGTPQRYYGEWKDPFPKTIGQLERELGHAPTAQDLLFAGLLTPVNLLDVIRQFVAFEADGSSHRTVRKLCRYQQYRAVNKAVARAMGGAKVVRAEAESPTKPPPHSIDPTTRGGVVWHTQGSGKSLTMLWLALKLRRERALDNPTIVIVTDRTDLDAQITGTFHACGFPNPQRAESVRHLRELLASGATGLTVLTTVQKFQEIETAKPGAGKKRRSARDFATFSTADNIFVLADEAHRTQYGGLAANLRKALPNACFIGFTGTPIDKKDRSTQATFGHYIDTYTIEQAVADGATVPIFYESRLPEVRVVGQTLDQLFDRVFADRSEEEREAIKKRYGNEEAIASAPKRIETICLDLIQHYEQYIRPNGFKAQVVATSRDAAVTYKETLDRLHAPPSAVIFSAQHNDEEHLARHHTSAEQRRALVARFLDKSDPLSILVVCDMLLTGFDAPVEQVMYLDAPLREHTLLQAIARTNRTADGKDYGLIVDYWGVSEELQKALAIFAPADVKGAMTPKIDELPRLQQRHAVVLRFFAQVKDRNDLDQCVAVLEPEDVRAEFNVAFRRFAQSLDMLLPDPRALPYRDDGRWLGKIRAAASARYRDGRLDISDCGAKVRKLIEDAIVADKIEVLVAKVPIFSKQFDEQVGRLKSDEARASAMEHALKDEIHVKLDENPAFYSSLRERLEQIIEDRRQQRIDAAEQLKLFEALRQELRAEDEAAEKHDLTPTAYAIYGLLGKEVVWTAAESSPSYGTEERRRDLASVVETALVPYLGIVDWQHKDDVQRQARRDIKRQLRVAGISDEKVEPLAGSILDLAKVRKGK